MPQAPATILVADDSASVRKLVAARLRRDGFAVSEAEDGVAAWEQLEAGAPDVLIVDDVLPALSGVEIVQALRARGGHEPRVVFVVEYDSGLWRAELAGIPPEAVVRKPFDLDELARRVRAVVAPP